MNQAFSLSKVYDEAGVALSARELVTAMAAARRVGYSLPMPQEPIGSPIDFYNENYASQAETAIGGMNEAAVMDFDLSLAVTKLYWLARYKVLWEPDSSEAMEAVTGLVEKLMARHPAEDLGFVQNPHGGGGTAVAVVDGRTTLVDLAVAAEQLKPAFESLWGGIGSQGG